MFTFYMHLHRLPWKWGLCILIKEKLKLHQHFLINDSNIMQEGVGVLIFLSSLLVYTVFSAAHVLLNAS